MRRRDLLENIAFAQGREAQEGVNTTSGWFSTKNAGLLFDGARSLECVFVIDNTTGTFQIPASFGSSMMALEITPAADSLKYYCGGLFIQTPIIKGKEYHAVITYDGVSAASAYLNGSLIGSFTPKSYVVSNYFTVGSSSGAYNFAGNVRLCRHYNYALSAADVATLWNGGDPAGYVLPAAMKDHTPLIPLPGLDSGTWTGSESVYSVGVSLPGRLCSGVTYLIDYEISGYEVGVPFLMLGPSGKGNVSIYLMAENGRHQVVGKCMAPFEGIVPFIVMYGGWNNSDRRLTLKIHSVIPLGCIAEYLPQNATPEIWIDSSRQLPLNDEHLPPLRGSIGGYDLTASGVPQIAHKPTLCQTWRKMSPMTLRGCPRSGGGCPAANCRRGDSNHLQ